MDNETDIMDFYTSDSKLSDLIETDFNDILNHDDITPPHNSPLGLEDYDMDADWLDSFLEDPILNDRMITDALHPAPITNEHSYSLNRDQPTSPFCNIKSEIHRDLDTDLVDNQIGNSPLDFSEKTGMNSSGKTAVDIIDSCTVKQEPASPASVQQNDSLMITTTTVSQALQNSQTLLKQPTIILATTQAQTPHIAPKVSIKVEPQDAFMTTHHYMYDTVELPPTPPSSSSSDSEGSQSPGRSVPSSPVRQSHLSPCSRQVSSHAALFSQPIPTSGVLILTEEEKRTLISEGYPIPSKLPLTKQEEKNLKKIRRKIKNKISAQESRRKKKEYMETLEKRMEMYSQENLDLKKKVENLECNNRSLLSQLQKLQSIVSKVTKGASGTQSSTCLMVLVLCFAVFLGGWSPLHNGGSSLGSAGPVAMGPTGIPMGPEVKDASVDAYATPNMRSRVLLSMMGEDEQYGPYTPFSYRDIFHRLFHGSYMMYPSCETESSKPSQPQVPKPQVDEATTASSPHEEKPAVVTVAANNATNVASQALPDVRTIVSTPVSAVTMDSRNIEE